MGIVMAHNLLVLRSFQGNTRIEAGILFHFYAVLCIFLLLLDD